MSRKHKPKAGTRMIISGLREKPVPRKMRKPGPDGKPRYYVEIITPPGVVQKEESPGEQPAK